MILKNKSTGLKIPIVYYVSSWINIMCYGLRRYSKESPIVLIARQHMSPRLLSLLKNSLGIGVCLNYACAVYANGYAVGLKLKSIIN